MVTLAFATHNVRETQKHLKESGVTLIHDEPQFSPVGEWFAFEDPFGNIREIVQLQCMIG
jgi:predicted enzyme related to lactoylglutathione lyase